MRILVGILSGFLTFFGSIQPSFASDISDWLSSLKITKPYIYKITGGKRPSYIFGSLHYGLSINQLPEWVLALHDRTEIHAYEIPDPNAERLKKEFEDAGIAKMLRQSRARQKDPEIISRLTLLGVPRSLAPFILESPTSGWDACEFTVFADLVFDQKFKNLDLEFELQSHLTHKKILALDTEELRQRAQAAANEGACDLRDYSVWDVLTARESLIGGIEKYIQGLDKSANEDPGMVLRNLAWIKKLESPLKRSSLFITVGADHLFGKTGLIEQFSARGYKVERMEAQKQTQP